MCSYIVLLSMLSYSYYIINYRHVGSPGHGNNVMDDINATDKGYLSMLTKKFNLLITQQTIPKW